MSYLRIGLALCLLTTLNPAASGADGPMSFPIGDTLVAVPELEGFIDACSNDKDLSSLVSSMIPASKEMITCFLTPIDYKAFKSTGGGRISTFFILQIMTATRDGGVSQEQFDAFVSSLEVQFGDQFEAFWESHKAELDASLDRARAAAGELVGREVKLELGQHAPIETIRASARLFLTVWLSRTRGQVAGKEVDSSQVQTSAALLVRGRVLVLFGNRRYEDGADVETLKALTRDWATMILTANEAGEPVD